MDGRVKQTLQSWFWLLAFLLLPLSAQCQNTALTGSFDLPNGGGFNGYLQLTLPVPASASGTCSGGPAEVIPNSTVQVQIVNGAMQSPPHVWGADCLTPVCTPYNVRLVDSGGNTILQDQWIIAGSTFNVGSAESFSLTGCPAPGTQQSGVVVSINGQTGPFTFNFDSGAGSCAGNTCHFSGSGSGGSGGGTLTTLTANSWPSWLVPSITPNGNTVDLSVVANPIPNAGLVNSSMTVNGVTCTLGGTCTPPSTSGVTQVNSNSGPLVLTFSSGAGSCNYSGGTTTCNFTGSSTGGGSVTAFTALTANWPTWLAPTVVNGTTTPDLRVAASAIPNAALANASITVNGTVCTLGSTCTPTSAASFSNQTANTVLAGPASGSAATPTFRNLVLADAEFFSALGDIIYGGAGGAPTLLNGPTVGSLPWILTSTPSGGIAQALQWALPGIPGRAVTSGSTDTIGASDRGSTVVYTGSTNLTSTITSAATLSAYFDFATQNQGPAIVTLVPGSGTLDGQSSLTLNQGEWCAGNSKDNTNYDLRCSSGLLAAGAGISFSRKTYGQTVIVGNEEVVTFSATPTFSLGTSQSTITLTGNVTSFTLNAGVNGQLKTLVFCQDGSGGHTVTAPGNVHGFFTVGTTASKCSVQNFLYSSVQAAWLASGTGVTNE